MPRSIFQKKQPADPPQDSILFPTGWTYIGETVQNYTADFAKTPVWNWVGNNWIQLNAGSNVVDYSIVNVTATSAQITISDAISPNFVTFRVAIDGGDPTDYPGDTRTIHLTGLTADTTYSVNVIAQDTAGLWTNNNIQTFTTSVDPLPLTVTDLNSPSRTNSSINLAWTTPAGSSAVKYNVFRGIRGQTGWDWIKTVSGTSAFIGGLKEDTEYRYMVRGINSSGLVGPVSNWVKWATGHDSIKSTGSFSGEFIQPLEWGSYRSDIAWKLWYARTRNNTSVYQGYWQGPNNTGPTPNVILSEQAGRYSGVVTYNRTQFRDRIAKRFGSKVPKNLKVTRASLRRVYRMREPGNAYAQYMLWHLTNTNPFNAGPPPRYLTHRNNRNSADKVLAHDKMKAGTIIYGLRLPRTYGESIIKGRTPGGIAVNGIVLYRGDNENNGYGTAGYGEWAGHLAFDRNPYYNDSWRYSDWSMAISAKWDFWARYYKAPYEW